tara:strand:+ start:253 stop:528 length:276 start_codon:yes stop_codon:yes gene_type:complete
MLIKTCQILPWKKIYVAGCQSIKSDQTNFGTRPKSGKNKLSDFAIDCKRKIKKFIETNVLIADVKSAGLYENSPGFDWNWYFIDISNINKQ